MTREDAEKVEARFWVKVDRSVGTSNRCWKWLGAKNSRGYGQFWVGGTSIRAHRFCWTLTFGIIPTGKLVLHACDNPLCVRPSHLFLGTDADNNHDMRLKGRAVRNSGITNSHAKLTEQEVREIRARHGTISSVKMAAEYGVNPTTIQRIHKGMRWTHLKN